MYTYAQLAEPDLGWDPGLERNVYIPVHTSMHLYIHPVLVCTALVLDLTYCMMHSLAPHSQLVVCALILIFLSPADSSSMTSAILMPFFCTCTCRYVHLHVRPAGAWLPLIGSYTACQWLLYQYIPVHTHIYWYLRVCTSTHCYVLVMVYSTYQCCMYWYIVHTL